MNKIFIPCMKQHDRVASRLPALFAIGREIFPTKGAHILGTIFLTSMRENSSQDCYYHDAAHMFAAAIEADDIAKHLGLGIPTRQEIFIAELYHDYHHSKGKEKDIYNIRNALNALLDHSKKYDFENNLGIDAIRLARIFDLIMPTHYPFIFEPMSCAASIVRDADLLMSIQPDVEYFAAGLTKEFENQGLDIQVTPEEMRKFALEQKFYNEYARIKLESYVSQT